jgi:4-diphosphocytidyl-2-C-methyl-D-erythritol kinase
MSPVSPVRPINQANGLRALYDIPAPAKLNLFLHINGRRPDGYHLLQSVFMLIDWCDRLSFERRSDGVIAREDLGAGKLPAEDLCVKAARALQAATGCPQGVQIGLEKRLPTEAGLGGGSSNAATCLIALNQLWALGLKRAELAVIGLRLGADVPFFLSGHNAWVEGVGEQITPISLPLAHFLIVKPPVGASTPRIFSDPALKRDTKTAILQGFAANGSSDQQSGLVKFNTQQLLESTHNDLQPVVERLCPEMVDCLRWLKSHGLQGRMTGSGTAVFVQTQDLLNFSDAPAHWTIHECSNMDAHPLQGWCSD